MVECKYCDDEFDSENEMYLHWDSEHSDELNSHDREKVKKAKRKENEQQEAKMAWRKKMMMRGVGGIVLVALLYISAPAIVGLFSGGSSIDFSELNLENQPMLGNDDANITVVEFGDYLCPACQQFNQQVKPGLEQLIDSGEVKMYYIDFNVIGPESEVASVAAECVYQQDEEQYWSYHDALFDNQRQVNYDADSLTTLAEQSTEGLDYDQLEACISDMETEDAVRDDNNLANSNGVSATPTVFVNGDRVANWNNLASVIENNYQ